jgi:hypothetical protein
MKISALLVAFLYLVGTFDIHAQIAGSDQVTPRYARGGLIETWAGIGPPTEGGYGGDGGPATSAKLHRPLGVAVNSKYNLFIADTQNDAIREVDAQTHVISTIAGNGSCTVNGSQYCGDGGPAVDAGLGNPSGLIFDAANNLYIADTGNSVIRKIDSATGIITTIVGGSTCSSSGCQSQGGYAGDGGPATKALLNSSQGLALDRAGNLYIADTLNGVIREVNASTGIINTIAGHGSGCSEQTNSLGDGCLAADAKTFGDVRDITFDAGGNLYIADNNDARIRKVDVVTGIITTVVGGSPLCAAATDDYGDGCPATDAKLVSLEGIIFDGLGDLFISDSVRNVVLKVGADTNVITVVAGDGQTGYSGDTYEAQYAEFNHVGKIAFDPGKDLYIADYDNNVIRMVFEFGQIPRVSGSLQFVPVAPCRVADTRNLDGPFGGPEMAANIAREFMIPQSACGIPSTALAYSLNVTVVPAGPLGYLALWPGGQLQPPVSTANSDGRVKANAAIVPAGFGGVDVFVTDPSQVILDINGYFVPAGTTSALAFYPVTPCRVADTRNSNGPLGGPSLANGARRDFPIQTSRCGIPSEAMAYSLNVTAVPKGSLGFLTMWPSGQAQPVVSTLNAPTGAVTANAAIVPAGANGNISVYASNAADVVLDVNGYFAAPSSTGLSYYAMTAPCRVLDTRSTSGAFDGTLGLSVESGSCAPSPTAQAYVLNATVVPTSSLGYLTLWPVGETQPMVSTLNANDGAVTSGMAIVPTLNGGIYSFSSNPTQLILDLSGYFAR